MKFLNLSILIFAVVLFSACQEESNNNAVETAPDVVEQPQEAAQAQEAEQRAQQAERASQAPEAPQRPTTTVRFDEEIHDFGTIRDGEKVTHRFSFTNTGDKPLILSNVRGSCGCTVPEWDGDPIPPGETGSLTVEYDSRNKGSADGKVDTKFVTVTANTTPSTHRLTIRANVVKEGDS